MATHQVQYAQFVGDGVYIVYAREVINNPLMIVQRAQVDSDACRIGLIVQNDFIKFRGICSKSIVASNLEDKVMCVASRSSDDITIVVRYSTIVNIEIIFTLCIKFTNRVYNQLFEHLLPLYDGTLELIISVLRYHGPVNRDFFNF